MLWFLLFFLFVILEVWSIVCQYRRDVTSVHIVFKVESGLICDNLLCYCFFAYIYMQFIFFPIEPEIIGFVSTFCVYVKMGYRYIKNILLFAVSNLYM